MNKDKLNTFYDLYVQHFGEDAIGLIDLENAIDTGDYSKVNSMMVSAFELWQDAAKDAAEIIKNISKAV